MKKVWKDGVRRRDFLKAGLTGAAAVGAAGTGGLFPMVEALAALPRGDVFLALGETLIPTTATSPGFKSFDPHGITKEVMGQLSAISDDDVDVFNRSSVGAFGKSFVELDDKSRADYLRAILSGSATVGDAAVLKKLQMVLRLTKVASMTLFYHNFPEHRVKRDASGNPIARPGETHLVFNPNTKELKTAWDTTRFGGPISWEEEEERRKRLLPLWAEFEKKMHS